MSETEWVTHPHHLQLTAHHPLKAWSSLVPSVAMCSVSTQPSATPKCVPKPNISQTFTMKEQTELGETNTGWARDTPRMSAAIKFWKAAAAAAAPPGTGFFPRWLRSSAVMAERWRELTAAINWCKLLRHSLAHRRLLRNQGCTWGPQKQ